MFVWIKFKLIMLLAGVDMHVGFMFKASGPCCLCTFKILSEPLNNLSSVLILRWP